MLLHGELGREAERLAHRLGHHVAEHQRAVRDAPFALPLLEAVEVARQSGDAAVREALEHEHVGLDEGTVLRPELDQHVGIEMHRVVLVRVQLRDMRQEGIGRTLEKAVIVEGIVMVEGARERPVLAVDRAREALQAILDRRARFELVEKAVEELAQHEQRLVHAVVLMLSSFSSPSSAPSSIEKRSPKSNRSSFWKPG